VITFPTVCAHILGQLSQWRYPPLTYEAKRKILGLNNAGLYGLYGRAAMPQGYSPVPKDFGSQVPDSLVNSHFFSWRTRGEG
jgi:hypothetical protein